MVLKISVVALLAVMLVGNVQADIVLQDNFEYEATRTGTGADAFVSSGPWEGAMSINRTGGNAGTCGYLYTVTQPEFQSTTGYTGAFPGQSSSRVMKWEFLTATNSCEQTNLYLAIGDNDAPQNTYPSNVWVQFWIYINRYGSELTEWAVHGTKWLYPCIDGSPTCSGTNVSYIYAIQGYGGNPWCDFINGGGTGNAYSFVEASGGGVTASSSCDDAYKLGHNIASGTGKYLANQWILVKMHIDVSGSQGSWEEWHKTVDGEFVKVVDWRGGVYPSGFGWDLSGLAAEHSTGHKSFKLGTTYNTYDGYIYLDDFVIATSEADLPTYGLSTRKLNNVTGVRVTLH